MTFFSLSAFASFDEYGGLAANYGSPVTNTGAMTAGGNFWSTNVSAMVANNGVVTNNFDYYSPRYYVGSGGNTKEPNNFSTAPSILEYQYKAGDIMNAFPLKSYDALGNATYKTDSNGNLQFGFIFTNEGSIMQPSNNYSGYTPLQINNAVMGIGNYDPNPSTRPRFGYNEYSNSNNTNTVKIYEVTPNGPVLVSTKVIVTYNAIPRVGVLGFTAQPPPDFYAAAQLSSKTSLTLAETAEYIEKYIDRVFADIDGAGGRAAQIKAAIAKYATTLPEDQKPYAETIVIANRDTETVDDDGTISTPIVPNKNYTFDENGNFKDSNTVGDGSIRIITKDGLKLPSELDANDTGQRIILAKIAVFLAKKTGAPVGSNFATGHHPNAQSLSSDVPAFTIPVAPFTTVLNMRSGKYSPYLDNVYSFTSILQHELGHQYNDKHNIKSTIKSHIDVYIDSMEYTTFALSPPEFKLSITRSLANYLFNMDKKPGYYVSEIIDRIVRFNSGALRNGGYKIDAPKDPDSLSNILFKKGELNSDNFKVYNPITGQNEKFTIKILTNEN